MFIDIEIIHNATTFEAPYEWHARLNCCEKHCYNQALTIKLEVLHQFLHMFQLLLVDAVILL